MGILQFLKVGMVDSNADIAVLCNDLTFDLSNVENYKLTVCITKYGIKIIPNV